MAYLRDLHKREIMKIEHLRTTEMRADVFTKALGRSSFEKFRMELRVADVQIPVVCCIEPESADTEEKVIINKGI